MTEQDERLDAQIAENAERIAALQREAGALLTLLAILLDIK